MITYYDNKWQTLHNKASNVPIWAIVVNDEQLWRISSMIMKWLVYINSELRNLGQLSYALHGNLRQDWTNLT